MRKQVLYRGDALDIPVISSRTFATRFGISPERFAWFLGAGASAGGGIPTGYAMIRDFRLGIFCRESGLSKKEVDATDPIWRDRIDEFFRRRSGYPESGTPSEYSALFQYLYPEPAQRRKYIERLVAKGQPAFSHKVLACLLGTRRTPCVFTTNFDNLVETAATLAAQLLPPSQRATLTVAALDNAARAMRCVTEDNWPLLVKLHGDFQAIELKNTSEELQTQDSQLRAVLMEVCARYGLIIVGYSGRDASVMSALSDALSAPRAFADGMFWVRRPAEELLPGPRDMLAKARAAGVNAQIVEAENFDEFAGDLLESVAFNTTLDAYLSEARPEPLVAAAPLPSNEATKVPVLRLSAIRLNVLPSVARRIRLGKPAPIFEIRRVLREEKARALVVSAGNEYAAFGSDEDLSRALSVFEPKLDGTVALHPQKDAWALGLLYDALAKALCRGRPFVPSLHGRGHYIRVSTGHPDESQQQRTRRLEVLEQLRRAYGGEVLGKIEHLDYPFAEAIHIRLEQCVGHWWCVFDPFTYVDFPRDGESDVAIEAENKQPGFAWQQVNPAADWIRERWAQRYNSRWTSIIDCYSKLLGGANGEVRGFWLDTGRGVDAVFNVGAVTAWSRPSHDHSYLHRR